MTNNKTNISTNETIFLLQKKVKHQKNIIRKQKKYIQELKELYQKMQMTKTDQLTSTSIRIQPHQQSLDKDQPGKRKMPKGCIWSVLTFLFLLSLYFYLNR